MATGQPAQTIASKVASAAELLKQLDRAFGKTEAEAAANVAATLDRVDPHTRAVLGELEGVVSQQAA